MRILIIADISNDIFIVNFSKWLKKSIKGVVVDVVDFNISTEQTFSDEWFDEKFTITRRMLPLKSRKVRDYFRNRLMMKWLKGRHYDVIHCHWLTPYAILSEKLKNHCSKLCVTFWGGELETQTICGSHRLYMYYLKRFLNSADYVLNSEEFCRKLIGVFPFLKDKVRTAQLGSAALEELYDLMKNESKTDSKRLLGIANTDKKVVMIGYSGKSIHRHKPIIQAFASSGRLKDRIHLLAPMTRGANPAYNTEVERMLGKSGYSYTLLKDRFLTDREVARLRNATDIVLQMSEFDGFSRSISECLCAGAILIFGDWLDYDDHLAAERFEAIKVSGIAEAVEKTTEIVSHPEDYAPMTENNTHNGRGSLWSECIKDFVSVYCEHPSKCSANR